MGINLDRLFTKIKTGIFATLFFFTTSFPALAQEIAQKTPRKITQKQKINFDAYTKLGTIGFEENKIPEGHKFFTGFGANLNLNYWDKLEITFNGEAGFMGELLDEDTEIPKKGYHLGIKSRYRLGKKNSTLFSTFVKVGYNKWKRDSSKYPDSFRSLEFITGSAGIEAEKGMFHAKVGGLLPLWSQTDKTTKPKGKIGIDTSVGITYKDFFLDAFYNQTSFKPDLEQPEITLKLYGAMLGYKF